MGMRWLVALILIVFAMAAAIVSVAPRCERAGETFLHAGQIVHGCRCH
jgi:hypothetical protein